MSTILSVDLDGLLPWDAGHDLQLYSPGLGMWGVGLSVFATTGAPAAMATSVRGMGLDLLGLSFDTPKLLDAARGDRAFVTQLVPRLTAQGQPFFGALRSGELAPVTTVDGQMAMTAGVLVPVSLTSTLSFEWRRARFAQAMAQVSPMAIVPDPSHSMFIAAMPEPEHVAYGTSGDLVQRYVSDALDESDSLSFGNPYPGTETFLFADGFVARDLRLPGAMPLRLYGDISIYAPTSTVGTMVLEPGVGPVSSPRIEGRSLFEPQTGVGLTPTLSWDAPPSTSIINYYVAIRVLTVQAGQTRAITIARIFTSRTEIRVPPGVLEVGQQYVLKINAATRHPGFESMPFKEMLPVSYADVLSEMFTP